MNGPTAPPLPLHLLRLVSQSLPVGAFSYSRGLEAAVHAGWVHDETTTRDWIFGTLEHSYAVFDGALFLRMMAALERGDRAGFAALDAWLAAGRESRELQQEDRRMGEAMLRLLADLEVPLARELAREYVAARPGQPPCPGGSRRGGLSWTAAFAIAAWHWRIPATQALSGLIWSAAEAQVAAAIRLVPLGHTAGQRILIAAPEMITRAVARAGDAGDDEIGNVSVALAMASAWHENQYSRLFRS